MILYFSGTGNSEYVAHRVSKAVNEEAINLFQKLRDHDTSKLSSDTPWIIVVPTYAWRIPRFVQTWLENTPLVGNKELYVIMTCGDSIGNAQHYLEKLCATKKMTYQGCFKLKMPENYIAMFPTTPKEEVRKLVQLAEAKIDTAIQLITSHQPFPKPKITYKDKLNSGLVNDVFYPVFVHAKKFYATDDCTSCGACVRRCPCANIQLKDGKPIWGSNCTHCMACISYCPVEAIEYGKKSKGVPRYTFPFNMDQ